jgi:glycine cleavage system pyridoxal-binding protein P
LQSLKNTTLVYLHENRLICFKTLRTKRKRTENVGNIGVETLDQLIYETIPADIRLKNFRIGAHYDRVRICKSHSLLGRTNKVYKSYIGLGYHPIVPPAIQRNIFENPGWYTATHLIKQKLHKDVLKL